MSKSTLHKVILLETNKPFTMETSWYPDLWSSTMWAKVAGYEQKWKVGECAYYEHPLAATDLGSIYDFHCTVVWRELCG